MPNDDRWKEQLAFVSGYILVFGFVTLRLWPFVAGFQTGKNINIWTPNLASAGGNAELWVFWYLTAAVGIAMTAFALAITHIISYGLWQAFFSGPSTKRAKVSISGLLDRSRQITYEAAFFLLIPIGFLIPFGVLMMLSIVLERTLIARSSFSPVASWLISVSPVSLILLAGLWIAWRKWREWLPGWISTMYEDDLDKLFSTALAIIAALLTWCFMWSLAVENCYTAEINLTGHVFQRSRGDLAELEVTLGGSTSDPNLVQIELTDSCGTPVRLLKPQDLGDGHYLSVLRAQDLECGNYRVTLEYPHLSFNSSFPFQHQQISARRSFLVIP